MNSKTNTVRAILLDATECDRPEADHPATIEICADDLQRILERHITEPAQCLLQIAEPQKFTVDSEMSRAFEIEYGQDWKDPDWRRETGVWASAWHKATNAARAAAPQAVQPAVPVDAVTDLKNAIADATELRQQLRLMEEHARGEVWRWQADAANELASMGNRMGVLIHASDLRNLLAAPAHPAEGVQAQVVIDGGTPGPWRVRKRTNDAGEVLDCFVTAPDCQGRAYDAHILGDDYDNVALKLADAELIVAAVNAYRATLAATQPAAQAVQPFGWLITKSKLPGDMEFTQDPIRENLARSFGYQTQALYDQPAAQGLVERDEALEAVRKAFCKLQRYSFFLDSRGNVRRCADHCGNWVEFEAVHTLFEPQAVDAALAAQAKQGGNDAA